MTIVNGLRQVLKHRHNYFSFPWVKELNSLQDVDAFGSCKVGYPIIADPERKLAVQLGMLDPDEKDKAGLPLTCRAVNTCFFLIIIVLSYVSPCSIYLAVSGVYCRAWQETQAPNLVPCHNWSKFRVGRNPVFTSMIDASQLMFLCYF